MKKVLLITTGGTLACKETDRGLEPKLKGRDILSKVPEIATLCNATAKDLFLLDSTNATPKEWEELAKFIGDNYSKYDGFVITFGTDTMAYTASALSHMLVNLGKPVVLTGSQLPLGVANSDARTNLQLAFSMAVGNLPGVYIAFGNKVIKGSCAKKIFSRNFNAFESINEPAVLFFTKEELKKNLSAPMPEGEFAVKAHLEPRVMAITITPGLHPDIIDYAVEAGYKGIVLEGYGIGGIPIESINFLPSIKKALSKKVRIICISQCVFDGVDLELYPMGIEAKKLGVEDGGNMTLECAVTKLMFELGEKE